MRRGISLWKLGQSITRRCIAQTDIKKPTVAGRRFFASESELKKTALYDFHVENGGKMIPFAGWSMPIQYKDSIMDSTLNFRANGSLFDVAGLVPGNGTLTVFTNEKGGAIDDSVMTEVKDDHIYLVVNAGCRDKDLAHIESHMKAFKAKGGGVDWYIHDERSLLALQISDQDFHRLQPLHSDRDFRFFWSICKFKTHDLGVWHWEITTIFGWRHVVIIISRRRNPNMGTPHPGQAKSRRKNPNMGSSHPGPGQTT